MALTAHDDGIESEECQHCAGQTAYDNHYRLYQAPHRSSSLPLSPGIARVVKLRILDLLEA